MLRRCSNGFHLHSTLAYLNYSTSAVSSKDRITKSPVVGLLMKSAGFCEEEAVSVARMVSNPFKCHKKAEIVIDFLKKSGFHGKHVRKVISSRPNLLDCIVDETLKPRIRAFQDFGFSGSNFGSLVSRDPRILDADVESSIVAGLEELKSVLGSNEEVISFMLHRTAMLPISPTSYMNLPGNVALLQRYGLSSERIKWLMPRCRFLFSSSEWVEELLKQAEEKLGIPRTESMFVYSIYAYSKGEENISSKLELFSQHGWSETDISAMLDKHPMVLCLAEDDLRAKLKYFVEDLGFDSRCLVTDPVVLSYSMEKRILPRVAVRQALMDRRLLQDPMSPYSCLKMAESKFVQEYVLPYEEKLPQLYRNYDRAVSSVLSKS